jgi:hypothetical protein
MKSMKQKMLPITGIAFFAVLTWSTVASAQSWSTLTTPPQFNPGNALLLTDGTVLVQQIQSFGWWKLTPQLHTIDYQNGTLTQVQSMPTTLNYDPTFFASAVLPDDRVIIEGGEYNNGFKKFTTKGAIYDPVANTWTSVPPPAGWKKIGDASSVVLPDGTFMLANCCDNPPQAALLDATTLTWTVLTNLSGFVGKFDENNEEGWTLLPNGDVLTVDAYWNVFDLKGTNSEIYNPTSGVWTFAGKTGVQLWDSDDDGCSGGAGTHETGTGVLLPDGRVFATGSNSCPGLPGHTSIYDPTAGTWTPGPDFLAGNDQADAPAALLPNGNVLVDTNTGVNNYPTTFYTFNGTKFLTIPQPKGLSTLDSTEGARMLILPSGQILLTQWGQPQMWFFTPGGTYEAAWQPTISTYPANVYENCTYTITGTQFNGLSQGAYYGDDAQSATNYPLVLFTNTGTGHQFFARTHGFSTMAVATGAANVSTMFDVLPLGFEAGNGTMIVIANGIPSKPVGITLYQGGADHGPC